MEYVDLVNQIIAAERSAQTLAQEVEERKHGLDEDLNQELEQMREQYMDRAERRISAVEREEGDAARETIAAWDQKLEAAMADVERAYAQNKTAWIDELFTRIVGE